MSTSHYPVRVLAELDAGLTQERDHEEVRKRKRPLDQPQPADPDPAQRPTGEGPPAQGPGPGSTWSAGRVAALVASAYDVTGLQPPRGGTAPGCHAGGVLAERAAGPETPGPHPDSVGPTTPGHGCRGALL